MTCFLILRTFSSVTRTVCHFGLNYLTVDREEDQEEQFQPTLLFEAINAVTTLQIFVAYKEELNSIDN